MELRSLVTTRHLLFPHPSQQARGLTTAGKAVVHTGGLPPAGGIAQPSEQRSTFVVSNVDGQLISKSSVHGDKGSEATKIQRFKPYRRLRPVGLGRLIFLPLTHYRQLVVKGYGDQAPLPPAGGKAFLRRPSRAASKTVDEVVQRSS